MSGEPFSKERQLARGERRYRRKVASPKQWQAIFEAKRGPCRLCVDVATNGHHGYTDNRVELHHVVPRDRGGDDVADNLVPLCAVDHRRVEARLPEACKKLIASLFDAEYAYAVDKAGADVWERVYGIEYSR